MMSDINVTPMVDVMLVLLVIFIITAPLLTHSIQLDLPKAQAPSTPEKAETVTVSIDPTGAIFWNNDPVGDLQALAARLADAAQRTPKPDLHLRADSQTRYQRIAEVMAAAQGAGLTSIGFVTDPHAAPIVAPAPSAPAAEHAERAAQR
ncbi:MAG: ExbD/TolR family protein [Gammaproteobacteria bacterium]